MSLEGILHVPHITILSAEPRFQMDEVFLSVLRCQLTLGTSCDQCLSTVQEFFTSTETRRLVRTDSPGHPPRLSHSSWTMIVFRRPIPFKYTAVPRFTQRWIVTGCRLLAVSTTTTTIFKIFPQWGAADAEIMVPSVENPKLANFLTLKSGQNIAMHASSTTRNFFHVKFRILNLPPPLTFFLCVCVCVQILPPALFFFFFFLVFFVAALVWANRVSNVGSQNKIAESPSS